MSQMEEDNRLKAELSAIGQAFGISGEPDAVEEILAGHINRTYKVDYREGDGLTSYLFQALNTFVFRDPVHLMENIEKVTAHIRRKYPERPALYYLKTEEDRNYLISGEAFWRICNFIPSVTFDIVTDLEVIRRAGQAFGDFQLALSDFDASSLIETIPDFHNTEQRYRNLSDAAEADIAGRKAEVQEELDWLFSVRDKACLLTRLQKEGKLPLRVTHNDTKMNNVLFDEKTLQPLAVVDLDTVMPGLVGSDFGDAVRYAANYTEEDSADLEKTGINLEVFRAFTDGFLSRTSQTLTAAETDTLADACFCLTAEEAVRFLEDYLRKDVYFKIQDEKHNLVRARCQIRLAQAMLVHIDEMRDIVRRTAHGYGEFRK